MTEERDKPLLREAVDRLGHLFSEARKSGLAEPSVATLATVNGDGRPTLRTMGISHFDENGFVFFTSSGSRKGLHLEHRPFAALCFYWEPLNEQVTVEGTVSRVPESDAEKWWVSRSRDNQFAAWASEQSARLDSRDSLQKRLARCREQFIDGRVPKPPHWGGYRLNPERIEFWHGGWRHLHERICYELTPSGWDRYLLNP
jgi:pyridoxamine 5'-phosphate oxidase